MPEQQIELTEQTQNDPVKRWFVVTNRFVALEHLHMEQILPWDALAKHDYPDLSSINSAFVPIVSDGSNNGLNLAVTGESAEDNFPVLIEISEAFEKLKAVKSEPNRDFAAVGFPIRMEDSAVVHFRNEEEKVELTARAAQFGYRERDYQVSPNLFDSGNSEVDQLSDWLTSISTTDLTGELYQRADSQIAALCASISGTDNQPELFEMFAELLSGKSPSNGDKSGLIPELRWLLGGWHEHADSTDSDFVLFRAMSRVAERSEDRHVHEADMLDQVLEDPSVKRHASKETLQRMAMIGRVLRNEADIERSDSPSHNVGEAFAAFLTRPRSERFPAWSELNARPVVRAAAHWLAGLATGRKGLPPQFVPANLSRQLIALHEYLLDPATPPPSVSVNNSDDGYLTLTNEQGDLLVERKAPVPLDQLIVDIEPGSTVESAAIEFSVGQGWKDCISVSIEISGQFEVSATKEGRIVITISGSDGFGERVFHLDRDSLARKLRKSSYRDETLAMSKLRSVLVEPPAIDQNRRRRRRRSPRAE